MAAYAMDGMDGAETRDRGGNNRLALTLAFALLFIAIWPIAIHEIVGSPIRLTLYNAAAIGVNYFQFGALRRALGGSIAHWLSPDLWTSALRFYLFSVLLFITVSSWIFASLRCSRAQLAVFAIVLLDIVAFWQTDLGRTDTFIAALLALAGINVRAGRTVLACVCLSVGLAAHELSYIYGLPLVMALTLAWRRDHWPSLRQQVGALVVIAVTMVMYFIVDQLPHSAAADIVGVIRTELPSERQVDVALYFALSGKRNFHSGVCINQLDTNHLRYALEAGVMILLCILVLAGRRFSEWLLLVLASVPSFVFLWAVATDMSRWVAMSLLNIWIMCALLPAKTDETGSLTSIAKVGGAVLLFAMLYPRIVYEPFPIQVSSSLMERIADRLGFPISPPGNLEDCEPNWRSELVQ